jgi:glycosyltransferase involved in cell wall biosynthesis
MPCYNGLKYIKQAVDSLLMQTHADWELIIGDDGSKDGTREYLSTLEDRRIKVFFHEKNLGIFGNLNFLFSKASYSLSQIYCQDDYFLENNSLKVLLDFWSSVPPEIAFIRTSHGHDSQDPMAQYETQVLPQLITPAGATLYFYIFGCIPGNLSNVSLRTSLINQQGGFREDLPYAGDFEFWSRVGQTQSWMICNTHIMHVRNHKGQASFNLNQKGELLPQLAQIVTRLYSTLVQDGISPTRLKLMATITYISHHRDIGIKNLIFKRDPLYLSLVTKYLDGSIFALHPILSWSIYFLTMGSRLFKVMIFKFIFGNHFKAMSKSYR